MNRILIALTLALITSSAWADIKQVGEVLTTLNGMTLYISAEDPVGHSTCVGNCVKRWPPLLAGAEDVARGEFSIIERPEGTLQWAFRGKPLYRWVLDMEAGQMTGDGVGGRWQAARP